MKTNTNILINTVPGGQKWYKSCPAMPTKYYEAIHHTDNIYLLWMESKLLMHRRTFPCVMIEDGSVLVFRGATSFKKSGENVTLIKRWNLFVSPQNIHSEFDVSELSAEDFREKFQKAQSNSLLPKDEPEDIIDEDDDAEGDVGGEYEDGDTEAVYVDAEVAENVLEIDEAAENEPEKI